MNSAQLLNYICENHTLIQCIEADIIFYKSREIIGENYLGQPLFYIKINFIDKTYSHQTLTGGEYYRYMEVITAISANEDILFPVFAHTHSRGVILAEPFDSMNKQIIDPKFVDLILKDCEIQKWHLEVKESLGSPTFSLRPEFIKPREECLRNLKCVLYELKKNKGCTISEFVPK